MQCDCSVADQIDGVRDLGIVDYFLGVEVIPTPSGLFLSQHKCIGDLLLEIKIDNCKGISTPMCCKTKLSLNAGEPLVDACLYRSTVGTL